MNPRSRRHSSPPALRSLLGRLLLPALVAAAIALPGTAAAANADTGACSFQEMRNCASCAELSAALEGVPPHDGRYEDNIKWTPLFGAFLKNCQRLALHLIEERNADPSLGGRYGSMLITVSTYWENRNPRVSAQWARMLKRFGADADTVHPDTGKSSRQLVTEGVVKIDYPEIWLEFAAD
ncbi:MAG: hypothetical protein M9951_01010 [Burkholderiaceae bacterium]|jgi:hypothetical protein|nr:hypothetical protein [Burkholderiaceae bacterium]MEB2319460.1 hypothetical protein [Pseudomonadota bacterium]